MSLVIKLSINDGPPIEVIAVRRTAGDETLDSINAYEVRRFDVKGGAVRQLVDTQVVLHRFGDGAAVLARKALEAAT